MGEVLFLDTEGIRSRTSEEVLQNMPNEQPLGIEFVPAYAGSIGTSGAVRDLKMRVHI